MRTLFVEHKPCGMPAWLARQLVNRVTASGQHGEEGGHRVAQRRLIRAIRQPRWWKRASSGAVRRWWHVASFVLMASEMNAAYKMSGN